MVHSLLLAFKKANDSELSVFAADVVSKTAGNDRYAAEQTQVEAVNAAQQVFEQAIYRASDGGRSLILIRRNKRVELELELSKLAKMLELHVDETADFFTETGFELRKKAVSNRGPLDQPVLRALRQGVLSGTLEGEVENFPKGVRQIGVEFSTDGQSWRNGTYSTGKRFVLENLNPKLEYKVRIKFIGTYQRKSDWSDPLSAFVM